MTKLNVLRKELDEATRRLNEVLQQPKTDITRDSAIKRFELAFDLSWKVIKAYLETQGVSCTSPLGCFKEAYRQKLIEFDEVWVQLTETRNKTVHTYDEQLADEVYARLPGARDAFRRISAGIPADSKE